MVGIAQWRELEIAVCIHRHDSEKNDCFLLFVGPTCMMPHTLRVGFPSSVKSSENAFTDKLRGVSYRWLSIHALDSEPSRAQPLTTQLDTQTYFNP